MDLTWRVSCPVQTRDLNHWKGPLGISRHCPVYGWTRGNGCELRRNSPIAMLVWKNSGDYVGRKTLVVNAIDGGAKMETAAVEKPMMLEFQVFAGSPMPFGATAQDGGYNFAVYTSNADLYEAVISRGEYGALGPRDNCWPQMAGMVPSSDNELIAEAWDAGGLYQVGTFPHEGIWSEWNGQYYDIVRQSIKGTDGFSGAFAECLCGSPNLYQSTNKKRSLVRAYCTQPQQQEQDIGSMCDPCNGKGWLVCDFCKGQKINVKAENNRIYRRCPSCRAIGYVLCSKCKVFKCVTFPDYSDGKL